jgi:hypothetical protein
MIPAFPKPSQIKKVKPYIKVFPDGREILDLKTRAGADEYQRRKFEMWDRQGKRCALQITDICKQRQGRWPQDEVVFGHSFSRGMGGGKRNDAIVDNMGKPLNMALCSWCNSKQASRPVTDFIDMEDVP